MKILILWNDGEAEIVLQLTESQRKRLGSFKQFYVARSGDRQSVYTNGSTQLIKE